MTTEREVGAREPVGTCDECGALTLRVETLTFELGVIKRKWKLIFECEHEGKRAGEGPDRPDFLR